MNSFNKPRVWFSLLLLGVFVTSALLTYLFFGNLKAQAQSVSIPLSLPNSVRVHKTNNRTVSGRLIEITTKQVTVQRQERDSVSIPISDIKATKGIKFNMSSGFYRCQNCKLVIRGDGSDYNDVGKPVTFPDLQLTQFQLRKESVDKGQAELLILNPRSGKIRPFVEKCKKPVTCVAKKLTLDSTAKTFKLEALAF